MRSTCLPSAQFGLPCRPSTCVVKLIGTNFGSVVTSTMRSIWSFARSCTGFRWNVELMHTLNIHTAVLPGKHQPLPNFQVNAQLLINVNMAPRPQLMMMKYQSWKPPPFRPQNVRCVASCPNDAQATINMPDLKVEAVARRLRITNASLPGI